IKTLFQEDEVLQDVWVQGEVSQFTQAASGHCYFTLKDNDSALACVIWRSQARWLPQLPAHGDVILAHGYVSIYEQRGVYQFYVDTIQPAGIGDLYLAFEALKARLAEEGLFDEARKRSLPLWPRRLGIITSADAAALRDILRVVRDRYPLVDIILSPTLVQGEEAPLQIVAALEGLWSYSAQQEPIDVIIMARGGGSLEELWAFNDEMVARAIAASPVPVICGVGHETDFTIADFVADLRVPTPTAAALAAVPDQQELRASLRTRRNQLIQLMTRRVAQAREELATQRRRLNRASPQGRIDFYRQRIDELSRVGNRSLTHRLSLLRERVNAAWSRLESLNPTNVLTRGYAIVRKAHDRVVIRSPQQVAPGDALRVDVAEGGFGAVVTDQHDQPGTSGK
ncbi:MAG TPA: exodeoxyribonuclease VII large subunit, partial [Anaerolineae bacterium]|nr:exodeoxyribonuclease VII large subunit [Anaerolineae bacterium]